MTREKQIEYLEQLRKKARTAYFYLGFLLICVLAAGMLLGTVCLIGAGVLASAVYLFWLRKDIKLYPAEYRKIATLNSVGHYMEADAFVPKNLFTLEQVKKDGCIMIENTHGIVRAGVIGTYRGKKVSMSDISYTCQQPENSSKRAIVRSGCYIRVELESANPDQKNFCRDTGQGVIKKENGFLFGFFPHRFLGLKEPDLRRMVTENEINPTAFPELKGFLRECNGFFADPVN